jgi:hypothetical protein
MFRLRPCAFLQLGATAALELRCRKSPHGRCDRISAGGGADAVTRIIAQPP